MARKRKLPAGLEHLAKYDPAGFPKPADRPTVAEYDCDPEVPDHLSLTERPMDDIEYADLLHRQELAKAADEAPAVHPLVAQIATMSEADKAALKGA